LSELRRRRASAAHPPAERRGTGSESDAAPSTSSESASGAGSPAEAPATATSTRSAAATGQSSPAPFCRLPEDRGGLPRDLPDAFRRGAAVLAPVFYPVVMSSV